LISEREASTLGASLSEIKTLADTNLFPAPNEMPQKLTRSAVL